MRVVITNLIFISVTLAAVPVLATDQESCSTVRLDQNGGPFEKLPVYDQNRNAKDDSNLCYSVTASLLMDAHRFSNGEKIPPYTAPLSVALNYKKQQSMLPIDEQDPADPLDPTMLATTLVGGGFIDTAIEANRNQPVCDQRFLQRFDDAIGSSTGPASPDSDTDNFLKNIYAQTEQYRRDSQSIDRVSVRVDKLNNFFHCRTSNQFADIKNVLDAAKAAHQAQNPLEKAHTFVAKLCSKNSFSLKIPKAQKLNGVDGDYIAENMSLAAKLSDPTLSTEQRKELVRNFQQKFDARKKMDRLGYQINSLLGAKNPTPVGIGYCHEALLNSNEVSCAPAHASVIVGRQFNSETKQCEFLVRDSYGPKCEDAQGKPKYAWPCANGTVRIPSDRLLRSASSLTWIPQK